MSYKSPLRFLIAIFVLALVVGACGSDDGDDVASEGTPAEEAMDEDMDMEEAEEYEFGDPMDASDESRVIEITANDDFTFSPESVTVTEGETVTFQVTNAGAIPHDFVLGDSEMQDEHEAEMAEMGDDMAMHDEPNAFVLEPGETMEMTWHMTESGEIIFGCHQPGHYVAGMLGTVAIEA
jgi:uncharacterized cupredoxin-like copper-binding protein